MCKKINELKIDKSHQKGKENLIKDITVTILND